MKMVSIREAMGSAATASAAGNAILNTSLPSVSHLNTSLHINIYYIKSAFYKRKVISHKSASDRTKTY